MLDHNDMVVGFKPLDLRVVMSRGSIPHSGHTMSVMSDCLVISDMSCQSILDSRSCHEGVRLSQLSCRWICGSCVDRDCSTASSAMEWILLSLLLLG